MGTFNINSRYVQMKDAVVTVARYDDGSLAVIAEDNDDDGYPNRETLSVNLSAYGIIPPDPDTFYVKDYSEHEGLFDALNEAGIAVPVDRVHFGPHATPGVLMRLTDAVLKGN